MSYPDRHEIGPFFEDEGSDKFPTLRLGDKILDVNLNGREFTVGDQTYEVTLGLLPLMFEKKPDLKNMTDNDQQTYLDLLDFTNALYKDTDKRKSIYASNASKLQQVIKPLLQARMAMERAEQRNEFLNEARGFYASERLPNINIGVTPIC